ncbi:hypothetical protein L2750_01750 [Shewanella submarina]|uniref:DoxX family protein n=1 Tax=Shewanella submarina TaxID=2016376 RepID=A0ABV7GKJ2_9GAMM|nr:hypothetical protein [Shewanella submarina]MCL1035883.1 hypothetical protein [Shewanella submarina]
MKKFGITGIGILFFVYGLFRLGISSLLLLQAFELINYTGLEAALSDVHRFLTAEQDKALFPLTSNQYLFYLWLMGALLITGGIGCLLRKHVGVYSLYTFLGLYVALFVNFQTINPKIMHLIVCALLLAIYHWLRHGEEEVKLVSPNN